MESACLGSLQLTFVMGDVAVSPTDPRCSPLLTPMTSQLEQLRAQVEQKKVLFDKVGLGRADTTGCVGIILNIGTAVSEV